MTDFQYQPAKRLFEQIDLAVRSTPDRWLPSLRIVHDVAPVEMQFDYAVYADDKFRWQRVDGAAMDPAVDEMSNKWIERVDAPLLPGFFTLIRGRLVPAERPIVGLSPLYLTMTASAMAKWPSGLDYPVGQCLSAHMKISVSGDEDAPVVFPEVNVDYREHPLRQRPEMHGHIAQLRSLWSHFAAKATPWLADSGITELRATLLLQAPEPPLCVHPPYWVQQPERVD